MDGAVTARALYAPQSENAEIEIDYDGAAYVTAQSKFEVPTITGQKITLSASVDIAARTAIVRGALPQSCIPMDFGDEYLYETWLAVGGQSSLRLDLTASSDASSSATNVVTMQFARLY